jgi:hypothetical protein
MKVEVQRINEKGKALPTKEREKMPRYLGILQLFESKDTALRRSVQVAQLTSLVDHSKQAVLPPLVDAKVLSVRGDQIRISGAETVEGAQYVQTWDVKVLRC